MNSSWYQGEVTLVWVHLCSSQLLFVSYTGVIKGAFLLNPEGFQGLYGMHVFILSPPELWITVFLLKQLEKNS